MPVKIQELVVQTKITTAHANLHHDTRMQAHYVHRQELRRLEENVYLKCMEAVEGLIRELKER